MELYVCVQLTYKATDVLSPLRGIKEMVKSL